MIPMIGRRVDYFHTHYNRNWEEVPGVVLWGEKHFTVDADEMAALRSVDGVRNIGAVIAAMKSATPKPELLAKFRRLAGRGVIDLTAA
jgi:hypothetical protein